MVSPSSPRAWIRRPDLDADFAADPVELFFDLAFVVAFAQLVSHLVHHPDVEGMLEAALLFWMLWLAWSQITWATNDVSADTRSVQVVMLVATVASIPMAAALSTALEGGGLLFASSVGVILLGGLVLLSAASPPGTPEWGSTIRYTAINVIGVAAFVVGIAIIALGTIRAGRGAWVLRPGHFAERHGLILIIALGEIVVCRPRPSAP